MTSKSASGRSPASAGPSALILHTCRAFCSVPPLEYSVHSTEPPGENEVRGLLPTRERVPHDLLDLDGRQGRALSEGNPCPTNLPCSSSQRAGVLVKWVAQDGGGCRAPPRRTAPVSSTRWFAPLPLSHPRSAYDPPPGRSWTSLRGCSSLRHPNTTQTLQQSVSSKPFLFLFRQQ